jgi:hypothetical protein
MSFAEEIASYQLMDKEAMAEVRYLNAVHRNFIKYLASQYKDGRAVEIAGLCDETLDKSGRLLGEVREVARTPQETTEAGNG